MDQNFKTKLFHAIVVEPMTIGGQCLCQQHFETDPEIWHWSHTMYQHCILLYK